MSSQSIAESLGLDDFRAAQKEIAKENAAVKKTAKPKKSTPKPTVKKEKTTMTKPKDKVKRGIEGTKWHSDPASYAQTNKLAFETGKKINKQKLGTWLIDMTKKRAYYIELV